MIEWSETERAYWSGMADGEMSFGIFRFPSGSNYSASVHLKTTDKLLVETLANSYSVKVCIVSQTLSCRERYELRLYSKNLISFLENVLPYLQIKHLQAQTILDFRNKLISGEEAFEICRLANQRGPNHFRIIEPNYNPKIWTPQSAAYYAGFTDAEGCFSFNLNHEGDLPTSRYSVQIREKEPLTPIADKYKKNIRYKLRQNQEKHANIHELSLYGDTLKDFTSEIEPYLRLKKPQANIILNFGKTREERLASVEQLRILNKRGT